MQRLKSRKAPIPVVVLALGFVATSALAQGTGRSLDIDLSIRAAGMGQSSTAVFWDELNQWSNPALLGYQHGLRYEWGRTQLVPGLAANVLFKSNVIKIGGGGLGVALSGKPFSGLGSVNLDYGQSTQTDENGNPTGTFDSFEHIRSWGLGVSVARALESVSLLAGRDWLGVSRMADVSVGMNAKEVEVNLAPGTEGITSTLDRGLLVRISPLEWIPATRDGPVGFDYAYGWSELSYDGATITFPSQGAPEPLSYHNRHGYAARLTLDVPAQVRKSWEEGPRGWVAEGLAPLFSVAYAQDNVRIEPSNGAFRTEGSGYEIALANVIAYRAGTFDDPLGSIHGDTSGLSVGLPIGRFGGLRYDGGTIPQATASGLPDVKRNAVTGWIDPLEIWRALKR